MSDFKNWTQQADAPVASGDLSAAGRKLFLTDAPAAEHIAAARDNCADYIEQVRACACCRRLLQPQSYRGRLVAQILRLLQTKMWPDLTVAAKGRALAAVCAVKRTDFAQWLLEREGALAVADVLKAAEVLDAPR